MDNPLINPSKPCAVILTALPVEYMAVRHHLETPQEVIHESGTIYEQGLFRGNYHEWQVGIVQIGAGNSTAAFEAERAINHFKPKVAFFVGVAGGIKDVKLGDVVAATKVYGYESGKQKLRFESRPNVGESSYSLQQRALAEARKPDWKRRLPSAVSTAQAAKVYVGPIAAGEKVLADKRSDLFKFIRSAYGDALAVEMEGRGFLESTHANQHVLALVIRGISDLIEQKSETDGEGWQERASEHAAAFAFEVLAKLKFDQPEQVADPRQAGSPSVALPTATALAFPIHFIPFHRNQNFTGRVEILEKLHSALAQGKTTAVVQAISGLGGVGKTQLALEYTYRHLAEYELIWWLRAEEDATLAADYAALGLAVGAKIEKIAEQQTVINIVRQWLQNTSKSWLLIFDNADAIEPIKPYMPQAGHGRLLITSRNPNWGSSAQMLPIDVFADSEATEFLQKRLGTAQEESREFGQLATELGQLPLALEQAAAYMNTTATALEDYLLLFRERRQKLIQRTALPSDYEKNIETVWDLSFQRIKAESPAAALLLNLCTFFAPDNIPRTLFVEQAAHLPELLQKIAADPFDLDDAIARLHRYSLVKRDAGNLSIHRLVQAVMRDRLSMEERALLGTSAVALCLHAFTFDAHQLPTWEPSRRLLAHALSVAAVTTNFKVAPAETALLWQRTGECLRNLGEYRRAQQSIEQAVQIRRLLFGEQHALTAQSIDYLGELKQEQGQYVEALNLHTQALVIRRAIVGDNHPDTAATLNNLGAIYDTQGEYGRALTYYEEALAIRKATLGDNHPDTATSLNNLGGIYYAQGDYGRARTYYEQALVIRKATLGDNHPGTATSLNNLGETYQAQGEYGRARTYYEQALAIQKATLGDNHPGTATSLNNLGSTYNAQGEYGWARTYFEQALAIQKTTRGDNHPDTATSLNNLGGTYYAQGEYGRARTYYEQALVICKATRGDNHPDTATSLSNLGGTYQAQGEYGRARTYIEQAQAIQKVTLGDNHPDTARSLNNMGVCCLHMNNRVLAVRYLEQALALYTKLLGPDHPDTRTCRTNYNRVKIGHGSKKRGQKSKR